VKSEEFNGRKINNLRFADDTALLANSEEDLIQLISLVEIESNQMGLELNKSDANVS